MSAYAHLKPEYPKFYKMDHLSKLGFLASETLFREQPIKQYTHAAVTLVLSNAHASLDTDMRYWETSKTMSSPALFVYTLPNIVSGEICIRHGIKGENVFFVTPQFQPELLMDYVDRVLLFPGNDVCLAGWIDVMGEHHDVFLYLVEKEKRGLALEHSAEQLTKLYQLEYGTVNGRS